jgi:histidinol-phosphate aminotransferase
VPAELAPRDAVRRMAPYHPPTSGRAGKLRLDFNENTVGCSPHVLNYLRDRLSEETLTVYPEYEATRSAVALFLGLGEERFLLTNGTDEAIQVLVNTFVDDGEDILIPTPSYAMYRFYAELAGATIREIPYRAETLAFPLEELLKAINPATRAILISSPNNPTGTGLALAGAERILAAAPRAAVLIDEAYFEFSGVTALPLLARHPNLFVSRTFSKAYGMAALRVGVLASSASNVAWMRKAQSPYSVNLLAAIAVRGALEDPGYVARYTREALAARDALFAGFRRMDIPHYPSEANFVLFRAGARAIEIRDALRDRGVLVRDRSYELPGCVRVTAGTREQVQRFFAALEELW